MEKTKSISQGETIMTNNETVTKAAFALDSDLGCIGAEIHTLIGVRSLLFDLKNEIEDAETIHFVKYAQVKFDAVMMLLNSTVENLITAHQGALNESTEIYHHVMKDVVDDSQESSVHKVDPAFKEALEKEHAKQQKTKKEHKKDQPAS